MYELEARFDTRQSFYGKARVATYQETDRHGLQLYSYGTLVAEIIFHSNLVEFICYGKYSQTTTRHQKEFFKQNNLSDKEIRELFKNGHLERIKKEL